MAGNSPAITNASVPIANAAKASQNTLMSPSDVQCLLNYRACTAKCQLVQKILNIAARCRWQYAGSMSRAPLHPTREQIELPMVLDCLGDPTRLGIVYTLAMNDHAARELRCGDFSAFSGKSNLAYHFAKLREAGLIQTRIVGTTRYMRLRRKDLDARFPGLLDAIVKSAARDAERLQFPQCEMAEAD